MWQDSVLLHGYITVSSKEKWLVTSSANVILHIATQNNSVTRVTATVETPYNISACTWENPKWDIIMLNKNSLSHKRSHLLWNFQLTVLKNAGVPSMWWLVNCKSCWQPLLFFLPQHLQMANMSFTLAVPFHSINRCTHLDLRLLRELVCSSAWVLAGLTDSSAGLDDPDSEDIEKLSGASPPTLLLQLPLLKIPAMRKNHYISLVQQTYCIVLTFPATLCTVKPVLACYIAVH